MIAADIELNALYLIPLSARVKDITRKYVLIPNSHLFNLSGLYLRLYRGSYAKRAVVNYCDTITLVALLLLVL